MNNNFTRNFLIKLIISLLLGIAIGYYFGNNTNMMSDKMNHNTHNSDMQMTMEEHMSSMNAKLIGKKGKELDKAFLEEMTIHHIGALEMARILKAGSNNDELIKFADQIINTQDKEINQMKKWSKDWYSK